MSNKKISIIGAGAVGGAIAHWAASRELGDIVLHDLTPGMPQGKAIDMMAAAPSMLFDCHIKGTNSFEDTSGSDIVIITAGLARKPGMSREELLHKNADIVSEVSRQAARYSPKSFLIIVSNPLDVMSYVAFKSSGFKKNRVIGMAGALDSARFRSFVSQELKVSVRDVHAIVIGTHGDNMIPLPRYCTISGIPLPSLLSKNRIDAVVHRTKNAGAEIVNLLKTGSAFSSPAAAVVDMADAILNDRKRIIPCTIYLEGEYGVGGMFLGVPIKLGAGGVEEIIELELTPREMEELHKSTYAIRDMMNKLDSNT